MTFRRRSTPRGRLAAAVLFLIATVNPLAVDAAADDPWLFLEDVDSAASMDWVRAHNAVTTKELESDPSYESLHRRLLAIYDSKERIPGIEKRGAWFWNFWRDADHERGILRRTTLAKYRTSDPGWETFIDLDALAAAEKENWVWKGWSCRYPDERRCIVYLSRGGGDATVAREFDVATMRFVPAADGGFELPEAKGTLTWIGDDEVLAATDFGAGTLTDSGYPRVIKRWRRGASLASATEVFAGTTTDVSVSADRFDLVTSHGEIARTLIQRATTFFTSDTYDWRTVDGNARLRQLDMPDDAGASLWRDQMLIRLNHAWPAGRHGVRKTISAGTLLAIDYERFLAGSRNFQVLFAPGPRKALGDTTTTLTSILVNAMSDVRNHVVQWTLKDGRWTSRPVDLPRDGTIEMQAVDRRASDDYLVTLSNALQPTTLAYVDADGRREPLKALPAFFDTTGAAVEQHEATSKDGTHVPYVVVLPKGFKADGTAPTILYGYGGFEISMLPRSYGAASGAAWVERGGVYVVAGIRGGGEFGPDWHNAALKEHRQRAYDDFAAVAEDLAGRRITSAAHLGIMGGSNGGLLVGAVAVQRPELFRAVVCQVPLLDMRRYNKLLAGASWMAEYGDPDKPDEWAWISKYSPYQNVVAGRRYPRILFATSTRDDRVHPGHARKMAAKMLDQKHDVLYYENTEGGHAGAANNRQQATMGALEYTFMMRELR